MKHVILLLALAVSLGACASTEPQTTASADGEPQKKTKRECTYEKSTGSRLGDRVCRTVDATE